MNPMVTPWPSLEISDQRRTSAPVLQKTRVEGQMRANYHSEQVPATQVRRINVNVGKTIAIMTCTDIPLDTWVAEFKAVEDLSDVEHELTSLQKEKCDASATW